jgi:hypothetical protein
MACDRRFRRQQEVLPLLKPRRKGDMRTEDGEAVETPGSVLPGLDPQLYDRHGGSLI